MDFIIYMNHMSEVFFIFYADDTSLIVTDLFNANLFRNTLLLLKYYYIFKAKAKYIAIPWPLVALDRSSVFENYINYK